MVLNSLETSMHVLKKEGFLIIFHTCEFRSISTSHFGGTRPPVSAHRDHLFRSDRDHFGVISEIGGRDSETTSQTCLGDRMSDAG
jgi:hypothetical protein